MKRIIFLLVLAIVGVTGCSSIQVQKGKDLSTAGIQYTSATATLVDIAVDSMIDADSEGLVRAKLPPEALKLENNTPEKLQERLNTVNNGLVKNAKQFFVLRASLNTVEAYFKALQTLTDNPQSETTATSVSTLADRVNTINKSLKNGDGSVKPLISDEQKTALSGLSNIVATQVHGAIVGAALKRDAQIIGESLLLQECLLENIEHIIIGALKDENARFYIDKVQQPFEKQAIDEAWVESRRTYLKAKAIGETSDALQAARTASKQMSETWNKILSGVYDVSEMRQQIEEVEAMVTAMLALNQATKPKVPTQQ